jgi:hypothetical protein
MDGCVDGWMDGWIDVVAPFIAFPSVCVHDRTVQ